MGKKGPLEDLADEIKALNPQEFVHLLELVGMTRFREEHAAECSTRKDDAFCCDCVPPRSAWRAPYSVHCGIGESPGERADFGIRRRQYLNDGMGKNPGTWSR